jgi:regulator of PEP synthase PpsR (kinase-PPPase family)
VKEKIFSKLKTAASDGKNGLTSIAEKTLEAFAEEYGKKITDESQIDSEIETAVSLLRAAQANINSVSARAVSDREKALKAEHEKALAALKNPAVKDAEEPPVEDVDAKIAAALETLVKPLREKLAAYDTKEAQEQRQKEISARMKELGLTEEDMRYVTVPEGEDAKEFLSGYRQSLVERRLKEIDSEGTKTFDRKDTEETAKSWLEKIAVPEGKS